MGLSLFKMGLFNKVPFLWDLTLTLHTIHSSERIAFYGLVFKERLFLYMDSINGLLCFKTKESLIKHQHRNQVHTLPQGWPNAPILKVRISIEVIMNLEEEG